MTSPTLRLVHLAVSLALVVAYYYATRAIALVWPGAREW